MTSIDKARDFLLRVLDWPAADQPGYCNLHYLTDKVHPVSKKPFWGGQHSRTIDAMMRSLAYAMRADHIRDIYFCLSVQAEFETKKTAAGKEFHVALRNQRNAVNIKVFAIDIDFKGGLNGYDSQNEAVTELKRFLKEVKLPMPSYIIGSGGGMHVYWVMDRALTPAEWTPVSFALAEATKRHNLKCDTQCTIDIARILRVPGTFNLKKDQPRPVTILSEIPTDYPLEALSVPLKGYETALPRSTSLLPARQALAGVSDLAAGIDTHNSDPIDLKTVVRECAFIENALKTGGKDLTNPLWNMTTLLATFTGNGRDMAHLMARKHPGYTRESTDELYDRKEADKARIGLGWPGCSTIRGCGAGECATCPHFIENKTPLHFGSRIAPPVPPAPGQASPSTGPGVPTANSTTPAPQLPAGYTHRSDGVVLYLKEEEGGQKLYVPVCKYPMTKPWLQRDPWIFNFTTRAEHGKDHQVAVELSTIDTADMRKSLQGQGMVLEGPEYKNIGKLIMAWVNHLQNLKNAVISSHPFGWNVKHGKLEGFIYGGETHGLNGSAPSANPDPVIARQYAPTGDAQPWVDAAKMITSQGRPELDAILASSFGAPLVRFTGQSGMLMSCYSVESGIGKSTTLRIAQAVWGDPIQAIQSLSDTQNSVLHKIGEIRALPLYWDELKTEADTKKFVNVVFTIGQGKEKSRLRANASQRTPGTWQTLMVSASNESLLDIVEQQTRATTAGIYRVFEYEVTPGGKGQIDPSDAQRTVAKLNDNYGVIGRDYAQVLGIEFPRIEQDMAQLGREIGLEVNTVPDERFWIGTICCILLGARYANEQGYTTIDEERLKEFLLKVLDKMRGIRKDARQDLKEAFNVSNIMSSFFADMRHRYMLQTNICRTGVGKPAPGSIIMVGDHTRLETVFVRVGHNDKILRISSNRFTKWLKDNDHSRTVVMNALVEKFKATTLKARIGSGTTFAGPAEYVIEIDLLNAKEINFIDEA
jgi:hypothetical protein